MSDTESHKSSLDDSSEYGPDFEGPYINERGDRHSDESSSYHLSEKADPNSKKKKYVRRFNPDQKKNVRVEFFPTNTGHNSGIKHAITGVYQSAGGRIFRTGTKDEDLFFSVILATGELGQNAPVLFYDNPEQYERHFFTKLPEHVKNRWVEKNRIALFKFNSQTTESNTQSRGVVLVK